VIVGLNFAIKITVIVGFNITRSIEVGYLPLFDNSVNHASLVIIFAKYNQSAFDELKFNSTIVTYLMPYIRETR